MNNNINTTGYTNGTSTASNAYNIIPSNLITMQGVSKPLTLVPIVNGQPQYGRKLVAQPGDEDIQFEEDVEGVLEIPYAQLGMLTPSTFQSMFYPAQNAQTAIDYSTGVSGNSYAENANLAFQNPYVNPQANTQAGDLTAISLQPQGVMLPDTQLMQDDNLRQQQEAMAANKNVSNQKENRSFIGAINPYGGWNMENTASALGAFVQNKNILGSVAAAGKLALSGARNYFAGSSAMKSYNESQQEYEDKLEESERTQGWQWLQKGGKIGKILTGNFIEGQEDHPNPNTEVEKGEYVQTPDGATMEVIGKKHSDGGELLEMPGGTKVVSDYLKIGSKTATFFKKEHGLNVKSSNSFATVLDKYKKKIGLTELLDEETQLMNKLNDQEEVEFEGTKEINQQVLSEKINKLQSQKEELEARFENFTNIVFDKQEQTKEPGETNFEKQVGGEVEEQQTVDPDSQPVQQQGDSEIEQLILQYAQITGQDPEQIIQQLQQLPEEELQAAVQQIMQAVQQSSSAEQLPPDPNQQTEEVNAYRNDQAEMKKGGNIVFAQFGTSTPRSDFDEYRTNYTWDANYDYGNLVEEAKAIVPFLERNNIPYKPEDLKTQAGMDRLAGLAQQAFRTNFKGVSNDYSSKVASTQQGIQTALDNGLVTEKDLKSLGVKVSKGQVLRGSKGIVPKDNENKLVTLITNRGKDNPEAYNKYVDNNFVDNKWYFRNPNIRSVEFDSQKEIDDYIKQNNYNLVEDVQGNKIYDTDKQGLYFNPVLKGTPPVTEKVPPTTSSNTSNPDPNNGINPLNNRDRNWENGLPMAVPDQSNLAPNYLSGTLRQVGHVQANAIAISPEETIKELNRQYAMASDVSAQANPYTAGAMQATLQAQTNNATNQAYSQAAITNAQDERNVANINEERIQTRDNTNLKLADQYEKESITGLDNYVQSWRNYIDKRNLENLNNWNLENQRQAFNATNDNFKIGSLGWYQTNEQPNIYMPGMNGLPPQSNQRTRQSSETTRTNPDGSKVKNKSETTTNPGKRKKGGLLLSNDIKKWLK